jgi:hypothetical protein
MTLSRSSAARLCTAQELELVEASHPSRAKQLSPARLRQKVSRSRKLRDKYRDLAKRQRLEARGKRDPRSARPARGHENTDRKVRLFQETIERFETALKYASKREAQATGERKPAAKKAGAKKAGAKKAGAKKAGAKKAAVGSAPAKGKAKPAAPGRPGAAARKGARRPPDSAQQAQGRTGRAHDRASTARSQSRRDSRNR